MAVTSFPRDVDVPIAVLGAGIGGLTAALALHRKGLPCRVFEQAHWPATRIYGYRA